MIIGGADYAENVGRKTPGRLPARAGVPGGIPPCDAPLPESREKFDPRRKITRPIGHKSMHIRQLYARARETIGDAEGGSRENLRSHVHRSEDAKNTLYYLTR